MAAKISRLPAGPSVSALEDAIVRAGAFMLEEAGKGFPETGHTMRFPHAAGFTGREEVQRADLFARAVLARVLVDITELAAGRFDFGEAFWGIAGREADYLAQAKLVGRGGGWSYFPGLPELPPDLDSLAAVVRLFAACAPQYLHLCADPAQLALRQKGPDGLPSTWRIDPDDPAAARAAMERGVAHFWGDSVDVDPCAHFFLALAEWDHGRFAPDIAMAAEALGKQQHPAGSWDATWYCGPWFVGLLCLQLLRRVQPGGTAQEKAAGFFGASQRPDGGWGERESTPLDTAIVLEALANLPAAAALDQAIGRGVELLLAYQADDGSWNPSPWIKMPLGRNGSQGRRFATWYSTTITSAFCLRALLRKR